MEKQLKVFISYRRANGGTAYAYILEEKLSALGIDCFFDIQSMADYNNDYIIKIHRYIDSADYIILLLQKDCMKKRQRDVYIDEELLYAFEKNKEIIGLPIDDAFDIEKEVEASGIADAGIREKIIKTNLARRFDLAAPDKSISDLISRFGAFSNSNYALFQAVNSKVQHDGAAMLQAASDINSIDMEKRWADAKQVSLLAIGCSGVVTGFLDLIKKKCANDTHFRFLSVDPVGASAEDAIHSKISSNVNGARDGFLHTNYETVITQLKDISSLGSDAPIEFRLTSDHITFTMHWVECHNEALSFIHIEFLPISTADVVQSAHPAVLIKKTDTAAYDFFAEQFKKCWDSARKVDINEISDNCEFCHIPEEDKEDILLKTSYWTAMLARNQNYPGRCIIPLNRHCESLSELTQNEWNDLRRLIQTMEKTIKEVLGAEPCNWTCLMNGAYGKEPPCPHVHFHLIPRYREPKILGDMSFVDKTYGRHYSLNEEQFMSEGVRNQIRQMLKEALQEK